MQPPKSMTATVHIRFHYPEAETRLNDCPIELVANLLEHVDALAPELQEVVVKFANYLKESATGQASG